MTSSVLGEHPGHPDILTSCLLKLLLAPTVFILSWVLVTLTILKNFVQGLCTVLIFYTMFFNWGLSDVFLMSRLGLWVWRGRCERRSIIFVTSYQGYILTVWFITLNVDLLISWLRWYLSGFSTVKLLFLSFPYFGRKSLCASHI